MDGKEEGTDAEESRQLKREVNHPKKALTKLGDFKLSGLSGERKPITGMNNVDRLRVHFLTTLDTHTHTHARTHAHTH